MGIGEFFKILLDSLIGNSLERMKIVNSMNQAFKETYYSGGLERFCKVSVVTGNDTYKHEMSSFWKSGFKITIENDSNLKDGEIREISQYILSNTPFVRQLMSLGFDTLIVAGKNTKKGVQYSLKNYGHLTGFSLE
jgi:hypothetical protein